MSWMSWFFLSPFRSRAVTAKSCLSTPLGKLKRVYSRYGRLVGNIAWGWACIRGRKRQGSLSQGVVTLADGFSKGAQGDTVTCREEHASLLSGVLCVISKAFTTKPGSDGSCQG
ncbi:hypothetical protein B0T18DRAFT_229945 [Schizothecium vesticola]|uniref:Secreted protein n=1 Tax=Schizothecium vesticola TaxID=314040 RepID=A0AA40ELA3_9PEZI|nr:hypothetical protein B0T18DRAFT_229945 [Schizothecium vesticola]